MAQLPDHYLALGVRPDADVAEIRRAWIRAARANHPDRRGNTSAEQTERADRRMRAVNEAWRVLGSAESRRTYDRVRAQTAQSAPSAARTAGQAPAGGVATNEPGGPGGFVVRHRSAALVVRVLPWLAIAVVGLVIFVASAYMTASNGADQSPVAAFEVGECFWTTPDGALATVPCDWPQNDGVLDQIITMSPSHRCRHPAAEAHAAPIAGRRLCLVPVDRWVPPASS
ncbi:J domain-containing protein [Candidatus Poriferisodalis sp.]|uniref:J domain-containing protein n=1 Tax=Candidatus Poriferisodalis sp. TaxID=3101277 RepID=UPI003B02D043